MGRAQKSPTSGCSRILVGLAPRDPPYSYGTIATEASLSAGGLPVIRPLQGLPHGPRNLAQRYRLGQYQKGLRQSGLLDEQVRFLKGWFRDSLPAAPIERLAVLRLDGDMYESTMDALVNLYPRLCAGGYVIVDDYGAVPSCRLAIEDFRRERGITEPLRQIDWSGVYWQR